MLEIEIKNSFSIMNSNEDTLNMLVERIAALELKVASCLSQISQQLENITSILTEVQKVTDDTLESVGGPGHRWTLRDLILDLDVPSKYEQ